MEVKSETRYFARTLPVICKISLVRQRKIKQWRKLSVHEQRVLKNIVS